MKIKNIERKNIGFTLIEIILVVTLIAITSAIVSPIYFSAKIGDDLDNSTDAVVSSLRRAQILSMATHSDSFWGVKLIEGKIIIFKGGDYSSRDIDWDENFSISKKIQFSGIDEVAFSKLTGRPDISGDIILRIHDNRNSVINVNEIGLISY